MTADDSRRCPEQPSGVTYRRKAMGMVQRWYQAWSGPKKGRMRNEARAIDPDFPMGILADRIMVGLSLGMTDETVREVYDLACKLHGVKENTPPEAIMIRDAREALTVNLEPRATHKGRKLSQQKLADLLSEKTGESISQTYVWDWETGRHPVPERYVEPLCEILQLDPLEVHLWCGRIPEELRTKVQEKSKEIALLLRRMTGGDSDA